MRRLQFHLGDCLGSSRSGGVGATSGVLRLWTPPFRCLNRPQKVPEPLSFERGLDRQWSHICLGETPINSNFHFSHACPGGTGSLGGGSLCDVCRVPTIASARNSSYAAASMLEILAKEAPGPQRPATACCACFKGYPQGSLLGLAPRIILVAEHSD